MSFSPHLTGLTYCIPGMLSVCLLHPLTHPTSLLHHSGSTWHHFLQKAFFLWVNKLGNTCSLAPRLEQTKRKLSVYLHHRNLLKFQSCYRTAVKQKEKIDKVGSSTYIQDLNFKAADGLWEYEQSTHIIY